ncbi:MAG: PEP-CTERM sorting domain-containing protein [Phycisphaerae bacterium]|nr:PEP-CTERM sorting domain-containing protein [Phycisphaerae bacterium]
MSSKLSDLGPDHALGVGGRRIMGTVCRSFAAGRLLVSLVVVCAAGVSVVQAEAEYDSLVASSASDEILRYDGETGDFLGVFADGGGLDGPQQLVFGPDENLYVASTTTDSVLRYDGQTGAFIDTFASEWMHRPHGLTFGPDQNLYVTYGPTPGLFGRVQRYDGQTGAFIDDFFDTGSSYTAPWDLIFRPDGYLYVLLGDIWRVDAQTGDFIDEFITGSNGGSMVFGPDGNLYIGCEDPYSGYDSIARYDGETGDFIDVFADGGGLDRASGIVFGPDGDLYVSSRQTDSVLRYDGETGDFIDTFATGGGLYRPEGLLFTPEPATALLIVSAIAFCLRRRKASSER